LPTSTARRARLKAEYLRRRLGSAGLPLAAWSAMWRAQLKPGVLFDLQKHYYLAGLYNCTAREIVVYKASQMGASEYGVSYAFWSAAARGATVLYLFPTDRDVSDFSTARFGPAIEVSPQLARLTGSGEGRRGADRVGLKRVGERFIYLRGAHVDVSGGASQLKSVAADVLIVDEVDEMDTRAPVIARHRLDHSTLREVRFFSTPTYAGAGIHALWLDSDQREWQIPCGACGKFQTLTIDHVVTAWDSLGRPTDWHGRESAEGAAWAACEFCGARLDRLARGRWVAQQPGVARVGYHLTKLFSPLTPLLKIVTGLQTVDETKRKEAFNQDLGLPYTPRGGRLTEAELDAARGAYAHGVPRERSRVAAGVDVGRVLHVVIREAVGEGSRQVWAGEVETFERLLQELRRYRVRNVIIDALPETKKAREFQLAARGMQVYLAYYDTVKRGAKRADAVKVNDKEGQVAMDRTRTLDAMLAALREGVATLPGHARDIENYYSHLTALVRQVVSGADGVQYAQYAQVGPDHLAHAENYCYAALGLPWPQALSNHQRVMKEGSAWT